MRKLILASIFSLSCITAFAAEEPKIAPATPASIPKVTVRDAKKICKEEGKEGAELLKCIKEKKGTE